MDPNNDEATESSDGDQNLVTLREVVEAQEALEAESDAVLGGSDDKNCTYSQGYVGRQALYACMTCVPESRADENKRAGICLACSYKCHEGHELIELYTKRNFRCDCGGKRMSEIRCKLDPLKLDANDLNQYSQNFVGLYCTCQRPFPDPEDEVPDEMIQCAVCEDWYHSRHLDTNNVPNDAGFAEMICGGCVQRVIFLRNYVGKIEDGNQTLAANDTLEVNVTSLDESVGETSTVAKRDESVVLEEDDRNDAKRAKLDICTKPPLEEGEGAAYKKGATFWNDGWRNQLCRCSDCMTSYKELKVEFLLDEKDTVKWYEENGREKRQTEDAEQRAAMWNRMGRVQQVEVLSGVNLMKDRLKEFFDTFVTNRQVITENDVREFFAKLNKEKSEMRAPSHFCR